MADSKVQPELVELSDDFPFTGDVSGTVADGSITDVKVSDMAASKLTGALPAISGAALTNLPATYTKSANDPATNTNSTVGALWVNQVSGETYVCTDATADANVWTNIGAGTGDVRSSPYGGIGAGTISGFIASGQYQSGYSSVIQETSFSSETETAGTTSATSTGASAGRGHVSGHASELHGFMLGGFEGPSAVKKTEWDKFPFSNPNAGMSNVSNLNVHGQFMACPTSSTHGYSMGGDGAPGGRTVIEKIAYTNDTVTNNVANMRNNTLSTLCSAASSSTHGYAFAATEVQSMSFATEADTAAVGTCGASYGPGGGSSYTHGYILGGNNNRIEKFSFATGGNATQAVGHEMAVTSGYYGYYSSTTHSYTTGGHPPYGLATIQKISHATDSTATNIGNLAVACYASAGSQH